MLEAKLADTGRNNLARILAPTKTQELTVEKWARLSVNQWKPLHLRTFVCRAVHQEHPHAPRRNHSPASALKGRRSYLHHYRMDGSCLRERHPSAAEGLGHVGAFSLTSQRTVTRRSPCWLASAAICVYSRLDWTSRSILLIYADTRSGPLHLLGTEARGIVRLTAQPL